MARSFKVNFDLVPLGIVLLLLGFGVLMVYEASSAQALTHFNDKYYFLKEQIKWVFLGLIAAIGAYFFDYRLLKKFALPLLATTLVLLVAVFIPGLGVRANGAHRWINLGFTVLQPAELAKLAMVVYLSTWLTTKEKGRLISFLLLVGTVLGLTMAEPDMGTSIVLLGISFSVYFLSNSETRGLLLLVPFAISGAVGLALSSPYRLKRILTFLNPESDPLGASYHMRQALIAIGSGGIFGLGLGNSRQKYSYLPEANTDSIFAIIGEELGLVGATTLIFLYVFFFYRATKNTLQVSDQFGKLLGMGIICWIIIQTVVNIGSMVGLIPLTGVPLPFISYGGSAMVVEMAAIGILFNIWKINL